MKKLPAILAATAFALALTACGDTEPPEPAPAATGLPASTTSLDGTYSSAEGLDINLGMFARASSTPTAQPANTPYVRFELTLTNRTGRPVDLAQVTVSCRTGATAPAADAVRDNGLGVDPTLKLADGKRHTATIGCAMRPSEKDIVIEIETGAPETARFAGEVTAR